MDLINFNTLFKKQPLRPKIVAALNKSPQKWVLNNLQASGSNLIWSALIEATHRPFLIVSRNSEDAAYVYDDLCKLMGKERIAFMPSAFKKKPKNKTIDPANEILRTDALNKIMNEEQWVVVTSPEGLAEKVINKKTLDHQRIELKEYQHIAQDKLVDRLATLGFIQVDFVYEPGQFSLRGSILDIFSYAGELPYRIDFFGDDIESIRTFDIERQLSLDPQKSVTILPDLGQNDTVAMISLFETFKKDTVLVFEKEEAIIAQIHAIYQETLDDDLTHLDQDSVLDKLISGDRVQKEIESFSRLEFGWNALPSTPNTFEFHQTPQPLFHKNFDALASFVHPFLEEHYTFYISSDSKKQTDRIQDILQERGDNMPFTPIFHTLHQGFIDHDLKIICFTDHQIFDRFHKFSLKSDLARKGKAALTLKELNQFQIGDFVVHIDHGIGRFGGLMRTSLNGKPQELIQINYQNNDIVYVSIHNLHRVSKYKGKEGTPPRINKLGGSSWEKLKARTKAKVKDIARDLILLYAKRKSQKGFEFTPDTYLQQELEASFLYEDTPDQMRSTEVIKKDMESSLPMDRLICGDVGFGKTELAVRAAFKAVTDSKQVAILVPTTILAFQHYKTFTERLADFPVNIAYLSRSKSAKQTKEITTQLSQGKIDILIGTHKIVGKTVKFADLGLLIIDEEQKFGVNTKEKLKTLKLNVDTLTLTATPIPRTLQFSLMGARDMSILTTPPPNRYPILTEICTFDDEVIREAILFEMNRNGQIYFIHNRVNTLPLIQARLQKLVPEVRIGLAHGQMPTHELEKTVLDFMNYDYDILLATTVVESGIDIPNVNTILINKANTFGLATLHQLRGRVGRSNRKAFCYLITPDSSLLSSDAKRRLHALETFSELGSGFNISMQDLDIRGAGNILGAEQSGFITDLGYETYQKILAEALDELKDTEFSELFSGQTHADFTIDCTIESDLELLFPPYYISNVSERMSLYRELDQIKTEQGLHVFQTSLIDRFGPLPQPTIDLLTIVQAKWIAQRLGIERLVLKNKRIHAFTVDGDKFDYQNSKELGKLVQYTQKFHASSTFALQQKHCKITFKPVNSAEETLNILKQIEAIQL